jgi:hypothetical protein
MTKNKIIDIDAEFDGVEFDEAAINRATGSIIGRKKINQKIIAKKMVNTDEWKKNNLEQNRKTAKNPKWLEIVAKNNKEKRNNPEHIKIHQTSIAKRTASEDWIRKNCRPVKCPYGIFPISKHAMIEYQKEHGGAITSIAIKIRSWLKSDKKPDWQYLTWQEYDELSENSSKD